MCATFIKINNTKEGAIKSGKWSNPGAKFYDALLNAHDSRWNVDGKNVFPDDEVSKDWNYWSDFLKEAYLIAPVKDIKNDPYGRTPYSRSGCKYPHHVIRNGELVLSVPGIRAAYARAKQQGVYSGELKAHLERHMKELGDLVNFEEKIESNFNDIYGFILERTGIDLFEGNKTESSIISSGDLNEYAISDEELAEVKNRSFDECTKLIKESMSWIENFVHDEEFRENSYNMMIDLKDPNSLMTWMRSNIKYGWRSYEDNKVHSTDENDVNDFFKYYRLQSPSQVTESKIGVCWDQCELQRRWFGKHGIEHAVFYIELQDQKTTPSHTFLVYYMHDSYWWFEHAWTDMRGIRKYDDLRSLILDVVIKHQDVNNDKTSPVYVSWLQEPPTYGITCDEFARYAHSQKQLDVNNLPISFNEYYSNIYDEFTNYMKEEGEYQSEDNPPKLPGEDDEPEATAEEPAEESNDDLEEEPASEDDSNEEPPELPEEPETPSDNETVEEPAENETQENEQVEEEEPAKEDPKEEEKPKPESLPKQTDRAESNKNGVRRKKLYIAFIEWCKEYNPKNTFGSIFDKDAFKVSYPFVPDEMRYFYRLANPMLCVLAGDLTFFPVAELRKLNSKNSKLDQMLIFAATPNDLRVFNIEDKKVYRGIEENGEIKLDQVLGDTYDTYIQKMINKGDILNGPIEESVNTDYDDYYNY